MKISKSQLVSMNACIDGLERFIAQTNNTNEPVEVLSLIGGKNTISDLAWLAGETLPKEKIVRFACDCALINIELIKPYTDKYDLIVNFLKNPESMGSYAAYANAASARAAAANAASAAAVYAARAANSASAAAVYAARAANSARAAAAAARAAYADSKEKVNQLLIELFTGKKETTDED